MSSNNKVLDIYQIDEFDKSKFALTDNLYSYDDKSLFTAFVDMTCVSIDESGVTFSKLLPKFDDFLNNLREYINNELCSQTVCFSNLTNTYDNKFIMIEFQIKTVEKYGFCIDVKNYRVIVDKTNKLNADHNYEMVNIEIIRYLHREMRLTKEDFKSANYYVCIVACQNGHIDVVKYLHREIGLTKRHFKSKKNSACRYACNHGHLNVVEYLHREIGLTKQDFQEFNNLVCVWTCENGHVNIVEYLHKEIGLTKQDFQSKNNLACIQACQHGHVNVVKYLHEEIGIDNDIVINYLSGL